MTVCNNRFVKDNARLLYQEFFTK